jgi:hypothetical protein
MISHARNRAQAEEIGPLRAQLAALQAPALEAGAPPNCGDSSTIAAPPVVGVLAALWALMFEGRQALLHGVQFLATARTTARSASWGTTWWSCQMRSGGWSGISRYGSASAVSVNELIGASE